MDLPATPPADPNDPTVYACPDGYYTEFNLLASGRIMLRMGDVWTEMGTASRPNGTRTEFEWTKAGREEPEYRRDRWRTATYVGLSAQDRAAGKS